MRARRPRGYILLETAMALTILCAGSIVLQQSLRQVLLTRALAEDYTTAALLLSGKLAQASQQYGVANGETSGDFGDVHPRFRWRMTIEVQREPLPPLPPEIPAEVIQQLNDLAIFHAKILVTVSWTRAGKQYSRAGMALVGGDHVLPGSVEE